MGEGPEREQWSSPAHLLRTFQRTLSCETGSFSLSGNLCSPQPALSLSFPLSQPLLHSRPPGYSQPHPPSPLPHHSFSESAHAVHHLTGLVVLFVSSIPWLLEFHIVWFSGTSGCLLILDWLFFSFWLCEDEKGFHLCLCLGWNSIYRPRQKIETAAGKRACLPQRTEGPLRGVGKCRRQPRIETGAGAW